MDVEVLIVNGDKAYEPEIIDDIKYTTNRQGEAGILEFSYIYDGYSYPEGSMTRVKADGKTVFYGWAFTRSQSDTKAVKLTAYDQLRYFKNKNTYTFEAQTLSSIVNKVITEYSVGGTMLNIGAIANTTQEMDLTFDGESLFDIIQTSIAENLRLTNDLYIFYDKGGLLYLNNATNMMYPYVVDATNAKSFNYMSTIDQNCYNLIYVTYGDEGKYATAKNANAIQNWGILQHEEEASNEDQANIIAQLYLENYCMPYKTLSIKGVKDGDFEVRGGSSIIAQIQLEDRYLNQYMIVDKVVHTFNTHKHEMDLELIGAGGFSSNG